MISFTSDRDAVVALSRRRARLVRLAMMLATVPRTGGAVEDEVGDISGLDDPPEKTSLPQDMLLAYHFIQRFRAYFVR